MRIPCPFCGDRDSREFVPRGDAAPVRPADPADEPAMFDYVYQRGNPAGSIREHWYHAAGCRNWIVVTRDTLSHAIASASLTGDRA